MHIKAAQQNIYCENETSKYIKATSTKTEKTIFYSVGPNFGFGLRL